LLVIGLWLLYTHLIERLNYLLLAGHILHFDDLGLILLGFSLKSEEVDVLCILTERLREGGEELLAKLQFRVAGHSSQ